MSIGSKIKQLREAKGWSQEYMSAELNTSQPSYSRIESGHVKIKIEVLLEIAKLLKVHPQQLMKD